MPAPLDYSPRCPDLNAAPGRPGHRTALRLTALRRCCPSLTCVRSHTGTSLPRHFSATRADEGLALPVGRRHRSSGVNGWHTEATRDPSAGTASLPELPSAHLLGISNNNSPREGEECKRNAARALGAFSRREKTHFRNV
ncbi:hypothetical protein SKAU_G00025060 [Synaphobranchus kaupii]|uniref:Uncharacterized protein n=1 Tax=Synaphobranchus kaupii TaxID=118154 RepID=A0A9Q1GDK0_SYNKA|nr:hypothetical protein SKAU_G00025060 [Synaphobranchus kaupii]